MWPAALRKSTDHRADLPQFPNNDRDLLPLKLFLFSFWPFRGPVQPDEGSLDRTKSGAPAQALGALVHLEPHHALSGGTWSGRPDDGP